MSFKPGEQVIFKLPRDMQEIKLIDELCTVEVIGPITAGETYKSEVYPDKGFIANQKADYAVRFGDDKRFLLVRAWQLRSLEPRDESKLTRQEA